MFESECSDNAECLSPWARFFRRGGEGDPFDIGKWRNDLFRGAEMGGCIGKPSTSYEHRYMHDGEYSAAEGEADHATESPRGSEGHLSELRELGRTSPAAARFAPSGDYAYHDHAYHPSHGTAPQWSSGYVADTAASPEHETHAARTALSDGECQLGGYLVDRLILGRPVDGSTLEKLRRANQTVSETRRALKYGRGNVSVDINDSGGTSSLRTEAGRLARRAIPQKLASGEPLDPAVRAVAAAMTAQAGLCSTHAHVAGFLHAAKLEEGEHVYVMGSSNPSHNWVEWRGETSDRGHGIVMDAWGKTSTILAEDGSLSHAGHPAVVDYHYDRTTGAHAHAQLRELQQQRQWRMDAELGRQMKKLGPDFRFPDEAVLEPASVLSDEFAQSVAHAMNEVDPATLAMHATNMARTLGASGSPEVARAAGRIAEVAADPMGYPLRSYPALAADDDF